MLQLGEILKDIYELKILKRNISNNLDNTTRFFLTKVKNKNFSFEVRKVKTGVIFEC